MTRPKAFRAAAAAAATVLQSHTLCALADHTPSVNATAGVAFAGETARIALLEARVDMTSHFSTAAAVAYLGAEGGYREMQLRMVATASLAVRNWAFENRHLISLSSESVERYRMRLRAARQGLFGREHLSARAFDELFFDFDRRRLIRNNVAIGAGVQVTRALSGEIYHIWESNRVAPDDRYLLALVTLRFGGTTR
jgi:hypothetical protein